jgi:hypothetical protein
VSQFAFAGRGLRKPYLPTRPEMFLTAQRALRPGADLGQAVDAIIYPGRNNLTGARALDHQEDHRSLLVRGPVP